MLSFLPEIFFSDEGCANVSVLGPINQQPEIDSRGPETEPGGRETELRVHRKQESQDYTLFIAAWYPLLFVVFLAFVGQFMALIHLSIKNQPFN